MQQMQISSLIRPLTFATAIGILSLLVLGGCYRHVVRAEGPGTETYKVYPPNLQDEEDPASEEEEAKTKTVPSKKATTKEP
jgi:hypothetical protein